MNEILHNIKTAWLAAAGMVGAGFSQLFNFATAPSVMAFFGLILTSILIVSHALNLFRSRDKDRREREMHELNMEIKKAELERINGE